MNTTNEQRTHAYLRPFQYYDACRMRLWRETRATTTTLWVGVIGTAVLFLL